MNVAPVQIMEGIFLDLAQLGTRPGGVGLSAAGRARRKHSHFWMGARRLSNKFVGQVEKVFTIIPKRLDWLSFLNNDLPIPIDIYEELREVTDQNHLNRAQTRALKKLKDVSPE